MAEEKTIGIKETLETLEMVKDFAVIGALVLADKKVNLADLQHLKTAFGEFDDIKDGIEGIDEVGAEIKDLDQNEIMQIIAKVGSAMGEVKEAIAEGKE